MAGFLQQIQPRTQFFLAYLSCTHRCFLIFHRSTFIVPFYPPKKGGTSVKRCPSHVDAYCLFSCFAFGFVLLCLSLRYALVVGSVCFVDDGVDLVDVVT